MKKRYFLIGFLLIGIGGLHAQTLSLDSCKILAVRNNAKVQNAALDIDIARQTKNEALTKYFPNLKLSGIGFIIFDFLQGKFPFGSHGYVCNFVVFDQFIHLQSFFSRD